MKVVAGAFVPAMLIGARAGVASAEPVPNPRPVAHDGQGGGRELLR